MGQHVGALTPLAAFQALCLTLAVGVMIDARKEQAPWRYVIWSLASGLALIGIFAGPIGKLWPSTVVAMESLGGSAVAWFIAVTGLYFILRPMWKMRALPDAGAIVAQVYDDTILSSDVAKLAAEVENLTVIKKAIIRDYQNMSGVEMRFRDELDQLKTATQKDFESFRQGLQVVERKANEGVALAPVIEAVRVDGALALRDVGKTSELVKDHRERTLEALYAIGARERLNGLEAAINQDASDLYDRLKGGEHYDAQKWLQWENILAHWEASLTEWLGTATWYALAVKERTLTVDEALYGQGWTISEAQFPNAEAVRRFKKFRIIYRNWLEVLPQVRTGMDAVAFTGLSPMEARSGRPAG